MHNTKPKLETDPSSAEDLDQFMELMSAQLAAADNSAEVRKQAVEEEAAREKIKRAFQSDCLRKAKRLNEELWELHAAAPALALQTAAGFFADASGATGSSRQPPR